MSAANDHSNVTRLARRTSRAKGSAGRDVKGDTLDGATAAGGRVKRERSSSDQEIPAAHDDDRSAAKRVKLEPVRSTIEEQPADETALSPAKLVELDHNYAANQTWPILNEHDMNLMQTMTVPPKTLIPTAWWIKHDHSYATKRGPPASIKFKDLKTISDLKKNIAEESPLNDKQRQKYHELQEYVHSKELKIQMEMMCPDTGSALKSKHLPMVENGHSPVLSLEDVTRIKEVRKAIISGTTLSAEQTADYVYYMVPLHMEYIIVKL